MTQGATPNDWAIWQRLGLEADLLPVVMDQTATISPQSDIRDLGKTPSRFNREGHAVGIPKWTGHQATARDVQRWAADSRLGLCVIARRVKAIDVDIPDPAAARAVEEFIELGLGKLPARRRANTGKLLLAFRLELPFPKRVIKTPHGIIELLSERQQFVAAGQHSSGARYAWDAGALDALPSVTMEELDALWTALAAEFGIESSTERQGMLPVVPRRIEDLQDPMVAFLAENGWVTAHQRDGRVDVRCPWEAEHTSDTGPSSTSWFPAGVGGFAQGHFRCLHAHCSGRTDGDFLEAVGYVRSEFQVVPAPAGEPQPLPAFTRSRNGQIEATLNNVLMALRRPDVCGMRLGFDGFRAELMFAPGGDGGAWRPFDNTTQVALRERLEFGTNGFKPIAKELVRDAVAKVADENKFDSAMAWAEGLQWDGVERIETFYSDFFGVADTDYTRAVARYTWSGLAARCLDPGHKCDMVPVFIGLQGAGKTTAVAALAPARETFVEINLERKDDDLARTLRGKLVGEIAELRGLQTRDAEGIKSWISREFEEWTPKWQEYATRFSRRLLFFGTGNTQAFLDDDEERRWLPMVVGAVDVAGIKAARDQLWAEGIHLFRKLGRVDWEGAYRLAPYEHGAFKASDPWDDVVAAWLELDAMDGTQGVKRRDCVVRTIDVLTSALGIRADRADRKSELRVGKVMRRLGFSKVNTRFGGAQTKAWRLEGGLGEFA